MVAGLGAENSWLGRQGRVFCCRRYAENLCVGRQGQGDWLQEILCRVPE